GASIHEINTIRKHLNQAFGGKLLMHAAPAKVITLAISDVAGDDLSTIASGPTVGDPTTLKDCLNIIEKYQLRASQAILTYLGDSENETPKPKDRAFDNSEYHLIATPQKSLEKARDYLEEQGIQTNILSSMIEGDTNQAASFHTSIVKQIKQYGQPMEAPCAILSGGETTVKITGTGTGGPNTQFMLQSALNLTSCDGVYALAADTDGIDGAQDNAGAYIDPTTITRAEKIGISAKDYLADNDSEGFFAKLGNLITPGPTYTNVNDFRVFLITK
ncbi:MAG: glycerate kinase type-2 family protein, partial [Bdellovibrionales bacterium]